MINNLVELSGYSGYFVNPSGQIFSNRRGTLKEMAYPKDKDGYIRLCISINNKRSYLALHRLIAITFIPINSVINGKYQGSPILTKYDVKKVQRL